MKSAGLEKRDKLETPEIAPDLPNDAVLVKAVQEGDVASFEPLVQRYQPRVFATARRYARRVDEVEDIVQEVFIKAFRKISTFRGDSPFEHWLMRLAVRTCYDFLRKHQRNKETTFSEFTVDEEHWLDGLASRPAGTPENAAAARAVVEKLFSQLSPSARLVLTLFAIEEKSIKEISELTGWSVSLVKVRAFRARAEMRKCLKRIGLEKYL